MTYTSRNRNEDDSGSGQRGEDAEDMRLYCGYIGVALLVFVTVLFKFDHTSPRQLSEETTAYQQYLSLSLFHFVLFIAIDLLDKRLYFQVFFPLNSFFCHLMTSKQQQLFRTMHIRTLSTNKSKQLNVQTATRSVYIRSEYTMHCWFHALAIA